MNALIATAYSATSIAALASTFTIRGKQVIATPAPVLRKYYLLDSIEVRIPGQPVPFNLAVTNRTDMDEINEGEFRVALMTALVDEEQPARLADVFIGAVKSYFLALNN